MGKTFWNKTTLYGLAGLLSWAITVLVLFIPFKGDSTMSLVKWNSPLGIIVIALFVLTVILYGIAILKKEQQLSYPDKQVKMQERKHVLPKLQSVIENRLKALQPLIIKSEKLPLNQYWEKYLKNTFPYLITKKKPPKPLEICNKLVRHGFLFDNLYYQELKENDSKYQKAIENYNQKLSETKAVVNDIVLNKKLNSLWKFEHMTNSLQIYSTVNMNNKEIPNVPLGYKGGLKGKRMGKEGFQNEITEINRRINFLLEGNDL